MFDEAVVRAIVLLETGRGCPDLGNGEFRSKVTYCALGDCPERREADRRIGALKGGDK